MIQRVQLIARGQHFNRTNGATSLPLEFSGNLLSLICNLQTCPPRQSAEYNNNLLPYNVMLPQLKHKSLHCASCVCTHFLKEQDRRPGRLCVYTNDSLANFMLQVASCALLITAPIHTGSNALRFSHAICGAEFYCHIPMRRL